MPDIEKEKKLAAVRAVAEIRPGMSVGLGTGGTTAYAIKELARRQKEEGIGVTAVSSSSATKRLATSLGIIVTPFNTISRLDITIDGADEIDLSFRAIKGGGGALLREKILASASDRVIIIVDSSKAVDRLGRFMVPVEVVPFADSFAVDALGRLGFPVTQRRKNDGSPFLTDQNAHIYDIAFGSLADPEATSLALDAIPGVIEHGLFLTEIDEVFIGRGDHVEIRKRPPDLPRRHPHPHHAPSPQSHPDLTQP